MAGHQTFDNIGLSFEGKWIVKSSGYHVAVLPGNRILEYCFRHGGQSIQTFENVDAYLEDASHAASASDKRQVRLWVEVETELEQKIVAVFEECGVAIENGDLVRAECEERCRQRTDIMGPMTDRETKLARYLVDAELDRLLNRAERMWRAGR